MASALVASDTPVNRATHHAAAPAWHTTLILVGLLGLSFWGAHIDLSRYGRARIYMFVTLLEWTIVAFIWFGLKRRGIGMSDLVGGSWPRPVTFFRDLGIAIAFVLIFAGAVLQGLGYLFKVVPPTSMRAMMPQTPTELIAWVTLSFTAGFCEEVIYRGYLKHQFAALTRSTAAGIVLQGIVFGLSHGYQGWGLMSLIALYGTCFGVLAQWRHSLRPGMLAHALQDTAGGLLSRFLS